MPISSLIKTARKRPKFGIVSRRQNGSALLLAFWAVAILTLAVLGLMQLVQSHLQETSVIEQTARARLLAESGLAFGTAPAIEKYDPLLKQSFGGKGKFEVKFGSEAGRLQINFILMTNQRTILRKLFYRWGLSLSDADLVIDHLLEWIGSAGNSSHAFQSVEEMAAVPGMDLVAKKNPHWRDFFTVWTDGRIDVNEAPPEIIEAVCGVTITQAERFCAYRLGADRQPNTSDDQVYGDFAHVQAGLGLPLALFNNILPLLTLSSPVRWVESRGMIGQAEYEIKIIVRLDSNPPQYLEWNEE